MGIKETTLQKARDIAEQWSLMEFGDIPRIPLYMEQVTTFFDEAMAGARRNEDDKILTKTMINNYTKAGTLPRPHGKKYSREHIIRLAYLFILKQMLSLQDIKQIFELMEEGDGVEHLYATYLEMVEEGKEEYLASLEDRLDKVTAKLSGTSQHNDENIELLVILLTVTEAAMGKMLIWRMLDSEQQRQTEAEAMKEK